MPYCFNSVVGLKDCLEKTQSPQICIIMSCHLHECIRDYGPLNHFWLFAFERFNGVLGRLPTNNRSIEVQMMKRFYLTVMLSVYHFLMNSKRTLRIWCFERSVGTLGTDTSSSTCSDVEVSLPHCFIRSVFDSSEIDELAQLFIGLRPSSSCQVSSTYCKYSTAVIRGKVYGSYKSRSKNSSIAVVELNGEVCPARINFFARVSALIDDTPVVHLLVCLSWFMHHVQKDVCGKPVTIWEHNIFEHELCSFLPVQHIKCRTVTLVDKLDDTFGNVLFVSPYE